MRRISILCISLAMSAFAFNSCQYPDWEPEPSKGGDGSGSSGLVIPAVTDFSVNAFIAQTKSEVSPLGELVWSEGDLINVFHNVSGESKLISDGVVYYNAKSEDDPNDFIGKLGESLKKGYTYDWYVFYPCTKDLSIVNNEAPVTFGSKANGHQYQNGYDNIAHLGGKYMPLYGNVTGVEEGKTPNVELSHLASVIEINLSSCMPDPVEITEIKLTAAEEIVGSFVVDFVKGTLTPVEGDASKTASLVVKNPESISNGEYAKFYLIVKPFVAKASDGLTITVNGDEKQINLTQDLALTPGKITTIDYTYYDVNMIHDSLIGKYKIKTMWVYGGAGPQYGGGGWVDLHNKTWWFDEASGHGITAERDNYLEFTLVDLIDAGNKLTGKCINWAGVDGKNWSCFFHNSSVNGGEPTDARNFYRHIPIGESTWVKDLTVTPNTITFTDAYGNNTVVEVYEPKYTFNPPANDTNFEKNKRIFPRSDEDDLTFHAKTTGRSDNWDYHYTEVDKVYWNPRDFFIDVERVDEIPLEAKTYEKPYDPTDQYPESIAGTYKYSTDFSVGGKDGSITVKGLKKQFNSTDDDGNTWTEPLTGDGRRFCDVIGTMENDVYTFIATGIDEKQNEVGTVAFDDGGDGTWEYQFMDNTQARPYPVTDATELYGFIAHDSTTKYVYDRAARTITFTTRGKEYVVKYLIPGAYTYSTKTVTVPTSATFGMHYDQGYTEARVANYSKTDNGFARHYVWSRHYILCLERQ